MCQILLRSDGRVEKGGVQTDKGTLQLYIVDDLRVIMISTDLQVILISPVIIVISSVLQIILISGDLK